MVALTVVLTRAARPVNLKTSAARSKAALPRANRVTRALPAAASRLFPTAIPSAVAIDPAVVRLTRNAATKMAGHTPGPSRRKAASAIPVGAHTAVALGCTTASLKPSLPAAKYTPARTTRTRRRETVFTPSAPFHSRYTNGGLHSTIASAREYHYDPRSPESRGARPRRDRRLKED